MTALPYIPGAAESSSGEAPPAELELDWAALRRGLEAKRERERELEAAARRELARRSRRRRR